MIKKQVQHTDYQHAKKVVDTLELHQQMILEPPKPGNFRKYLRELSKYIGKQYVTKKINGKLQITRLK